MCKQGSGFFVVDGLNVRLLVFPIGAENPLGKVQDSEPSRTRRIVTQAQPVYLYRVPGILVAERNEYRELLSDRVAIVFVDGIALAMTRAIGVILANRLRRRCPAGAAIVITQVNDFRLRIGNGIIMPGS